MITAPKYNLSLAALLFLIFTWGCGLQQINKEAPGINEVKRNTKFKINLPEDHTTGELWQLNQNFDRTIVEDINVVWHGNEKGIDFNFKSSGVGQTTLSLVLRKYKDTLNVKNFIVKIVEN